jgi:hypothetical protein
MFVSLDGLYDSMRLNQIGPADAGQKTNWCPYPSQLFGRRQLLER